MGRSREFGWKDRGQQGELPSISPLNETANHYHYYSGTCLCGHLIKAVTSLIQLHPVGPKQPQCIYYGMHPG